MRSVLTKKSCVQPGYRHEMLTVIGPQFRLAGRYFAVCQCDCGKVCVVRVNNLKRAGNKSCGCFNAQRIVKHGEARRGSQSPLYSVWQGIKSRCNRPSDSNYNRYGGRGIAICDEWAEDFEKFRAFAMENGWKRGLHTDRINNDGNYCPGNVRFVTNAENQRNKRSNTWYPGSCCKIYTTVRRRRNFSC